MKNYKKILLLLIFISFLISSFCFAQGRKLETGYPTIYGVETPTTVKTALPEYLEYVFTLIVIISGIIAFGSLVYGGFCYLTSAGDPSKMENAKGQIMAGFLGIIIVLSSYLILNTINPRLIIPEEMTMAPTAGGIKIYANSSDCGETFINENEDIKSKLISSSYPELKIEDKDSGEVVLNWGGEGQNKISSIKFLSEPQDLTVEFYTGNNFISLITTYDENNYQKGECQTYTQGQPKSIKLISHPPGVYLYADNDCTGKNYGEDYVVYQASSATLLEGFNDKTQSIKFVYSKDKDGNLVDRYATVLHEKENYMGKATLFDFDPIVNNCKNLSETEVGENLANKVSSITVYLKPKIKDGTENIIGEGVTFWGDKNYTKDKDDIEYPDGYYCCPTGWKVPDLDIISYDDKITSMEMDGHYIALLFEDSDYEGDCEVFMNSCPDFRSNRIGQCGWLGRGDCLSSFIIKARK